MEQTNDEIEISLKDLLLSIWDLRYAVLILIILGSIAGALFSFRQEPAYTAKASILVTARTGNGTYQNGNESPRPEDIYLSQNLTKTVQLLATSNRVLNKTLEKTDFSHIRPDDIRDHIEVTAVDNTSFLWLTLTWNSEDEAIVILNSLVEILPEVMMEVMDIGSVSLIDFAEKAIPTQSAAPKFSGVGALAGLVIGCFLGVLYYFFVPKVRSKSSLESLNLDIISEIPFITNGNTGMNCFLDDKDIPQEYQESYGRLAAVFHYITEQSNNKIIGVTSSISGEGKSTVAYNLALQLSRNGYKVLLLDFDFKKGVLYHLSRARKPRDGDIRIESRNTENLSGLTEKMYNGIYTIQGFSEKDIFHSKNNIFPAIHRLKEQFDYIIIDTPPVGIMSDVLQMGELIEGILLVVREDFVPVGSVEKSIEFLKQSGLSVTGCVLNGGKWG